MFAESRTQQSTAPRPDRSEGYQEQSIIGYSGRLGMINFLMVRIFVHGSY
jgi:hypothetical protein